MGNVNTTRRGRMWVGARVPYRIEGNFSLDQLDAIRRAMEHWEAHTPVRFHVRTNDDRYWVRIVEGAGCSGTVSRSRSARDEGQFVRLADNCTMSTVIHELGHSIGLKHEQQRGDRDDHVLLYPDRNTMKREHYESNVLNIEGEPHGGYDYRSIMHYSSYTSRKQIFYYWNNAYRAAHFYDFFGSPRAMLYSDLHPDYEIFRFNRRFNLAGGVVEEGQLVTPEAHSLGTTGWTHIFVRRFRLSGDDPVLQFRFSELTGAFEAWRLDGDGVPETRIRNGVVPAVEGGGMLRPREVPVFTGDPPGTPHRFYLFSPDAGTIRLMTFSSGGVVSETAVGWTVPGTWSEMRIFESVGGALMPVLIDRPGKRVARINLTSTASGPVPFVRTITMDSEPPAADERPHNWDRVDFVTPNRLFHILIAYDRETGIARQFRISSNFWVSQPEGEARLDRGMDVVAAYETDSGPKLLTFAAQGNTQGTGHQVARGSGLIGDPMPIVEPVLVKRFPDNDADAVALSGFALTQRDIEAANTLLQGNVDIWDGSETATVRRIGTAFRREDITDIQPWQQWRFRYAWAGRAASGRNWLHLLDVRGKPLNDWVDLPDLPAWRACCAYRADNGGQFMVFRNRNNGTVRRHRVTGGQVDQAALDTFNRHGRWDSITALRLGGEMHLVFINRGNGDVLVQRINQGGDFSETRFEGSVRNGMDSVAVSSDAASDYLIFAGATSGSNRGPAVHAFTPEDGLAADPLADVDGINRDWDRCVTMSGNRVGFYDRGEGTLNTFSMNPGVSAGFSFPVGERWRTIVPFEAHDGTQCLMFGQPGWAWD